MLKLKGTTHQTFTFPADLPTANAYYTDFSRILNYLPHVQLVKAYGDNCYRVLYNTIELCLYHVRIYADLQVRYDEAAQTLHVSPLAGCPLVRSAATVHSLVAYGCFTSRSIFHPRDEHHTAIDYELSLAAQLPKPFGLSLIPDRVMEQIATNIAEWRIEEIASGFIHRSIHEYRQQAHRAISRPAPFRPGRHESCPTVLSPRVLPAQSNVPVEKIEAS